VLLTGDGGDDVFLGYRFHPHLLTAQKLANSLPPGSDAAWRAMRPIANRLPFLRRGKHLMDYATGGLGAVTRVHDGLPYYSQRNMLGPRLTGKNLSQREIGLSQKSARRLLLDVLQYDLKTQFAGEFMTKVDGATMYYSLEARSPFLDQAVWEYAAKLPLGIRLKDGVRKAVLREIVRRRIGEDVATRKKQGFTIPVERWLATRWKGALEQMAGESLLEQQGWMRRGALKAPVAEGVRNGWCPSQLWYLLVLEYWLRRKGAGDYVGKDASMALYNSSSPPSGVA
jgi:asparagine synthase (glutamine-hydrolysing)